MSPANAVPQGLTPVVTSDFHAAFAHRFWRQSARWLKTVYVTRDWE